MRPVNLIPADQRRGASRRTSPSSNGTAAYALIGVLVLAVLGTVLVVTKSNAINDKKSQLAELTAQEQALQSKPQATSYATFEQAAQARFDAVYDTAKSRFPFERRLRQLTHALPSTTVLTNLTASLAGEAAGAAAAGSTGAAAGAGATDPAGTGSAPTFKMDACTTAGKTGVALTATRMRNLDGVKKVTIGDISAGESCSEGSAAAATPTSAAGPAPATGGASNANKFDLLVQFEPMPSAAAAAPVDGSGAAVPATATQQATAAGAKSDATNDAAGADKPAGSTGATP